jgi:hypothetical protein
VSGDEGGGGPHMFAGPDDCIPIVYICINMQCKNTFMKLQKKEKK